MKTSRIKNTVIVILALVNACLLVLLVSRRAQERAAHSRMTTQLVRLYAENGVELPAQLIPAEELRLVSIDPVRNLAAEAAFAADLLGPCASEEVGGGIYRYVGDSGQCLLRASGAVEASLDRPVDDPEAFLTAFFGAHGFTPLASDLTPDGNGTVTAVRTLPDKTVFNAELTFTFERGRLLSVAGSFVPPVDPGGERGETISGVTALVRFLDYSKAGGEVCTAITDVRGGYLLQSTASVPQRLIPAWYIGTDASQYYVNAATGEVARGA